MSRKVSTNPLKILNDRVMHFQFFQLQGVLTFCGMKNVFGT